MSRCEYTFCHSLRVRIMCVHYVSSKGRWRCGNERNWERWIWHYWILLSTHQKKQCIYLCVRLSSVYTLLMGLLSSIRRAILFGASSMHVILISYITQNAPTSITLHVKTMRYIERQRHNKQINYTQAPPATSARVYNQCAFPPFNGSTIKIKMRWKVIKDFAVSSFERTVVRPQSLVGRTQEAGPAVPRSKPNC